MNVDGAMNLMRRALRNPGILPQVIELLQGAALGSGDGLTGETEERDVVRDVASKLQYYEASGATREEVPCFFGEDRACEVIAEGLEKIERLREARRTMATGAG